MRLFTISNGSVENGALVEKLTLAGAGVTIPAIVIGEEGRGRSRGVLPVDLTPAQKEVWDAKGCVTIPAAQLAQTRAGKPKLQAQDELSGADDLAICVFRTNGGFRGGADHTGDRTAEAMGKTSGVMDSDFLPFPGQILAEGYVADGIAGRMGGNAQIVATIPENTVFRTRYTGRLYGGPSAHYYILQNGRILAATWDERTATDLF